MLSLLPGGRILVAVEPVDGRKGIDSLAGVVRSVLKGDPLSGDLFVFKTRRADKLKILTWMGDGFALYLRRLEKGTFAFPAATDAWVYLGDESNPYTLFDLTAGRRQEFPQAFLGGYRGFVHADAYDGYNAAHNNVRNLGCWMHARRDFVDAVPSDPRAVEALAFIRTLYAVEREIKEHRETPGSTFNDAHVVRVRRTRAGPILAAFADWLEEQHRSATPKSLFGQAVGYARNQWPTLVRYLDDARFAIDNGAAERAIRPLALGRSNWLHVGGDGGLKTASVLLSVCASATRHQLNPWSYLRDVLDHLAVRSTETDLADLLPDAPARSRLAAEQAPPRTTGPTHLDRRSFCWLQGQICDWPASGQTPSVSRKSLLRSGCGRTRRSEILPPGRIDVAWPSGTCPSKNYVVDRFAPLRRGDEKGSR